MLRSSILLALILAAPSLQAAPASPIAFRAIAGDLALPVEITHAGDGSGRLFVVEQAGRIRIVRNGQVLVTPFLDIRTLVQSGGEQGLLGLAFDPGYASNGLFYVYYTRVPASSTTGGNEIVLARYARSSNPDVAEASSGTVLLTIAHPGFTNHNGGKIAFGPDRLLYLGVGDGGSAGDPSNNAQNLGQLLGKLLRIGVGSASGYTIPAANPFASQAGARGEIFAYGLRNPWRFSFDRATGDIFLGDVGQGAREEVDFIAAGSSGQNFGWRVFEGTRCFNPATNCSLTGHVPPILEYAHDAAGGISITGGFRYRGRLFPELRGFYVYGDYGSGRIWAAEPLGSGAWTTTEVTIASNPSTFGEDEDGELYVADHLAGTIFRLAPADADGDGMSDNFENRYFGNNTGGNAAADSDADGIPNLQEYLEGTNPVVKDNDIFANARLFAMQQYRDFLAREGDGAGISFWTSQLLGGARTRAQMVEQFLASPEFQGAIAPVARLYFAYFLRIPDYAGLNYWIGQFRAGTPLDTISQQFAASAEFRSRYGSLDNGQFVTLVYRNVLGRDPDSPGFVFWRGQLDSGAMNRGQVMTAFSESAEFRAVVNAEVYVTMIYVGMLRRAPDAAGFDFWVDQIDRGNPATALIEGFIASPEYRARFLP